MFHFIKHAFIFALLIVVALAAPIPRPQDPKFESLDVDLGYSLLPREGLSPPTVGQEPQSELRDGAEEDRREMLHRMGPFLKHLTRAKDRDESQKEFILGLVERTAATAHLNNKRNVLQNRLDEAASASAVKKPRSRSRKKRKRASDKRTRPKSKLSESFSLDPNDSEPSHFQSPEVPEEGQRLVEVRPQVMTSPQVAAYMFAMGNKKKKRKPSKPYLPGLRGLRIKPKGSLPDATFHHSDDIDEPFEEVRQQGLSIEPKQILLPPKSITAPDVTIAHSENGEWIDHFYPYVEVPRRTPTLSPSPRTESLPKVTIDHSGVGATAEPIFPDKAKYSDGRDV